MDGKGLRRICEMLIGLFLAGAAFLYILCGENAHIAVHDNLDLFVAQYQMLREQGSFFSPGNGFPVPWGHFAGRPAIGEVPDRACPPGCSRRLPRMSHCIL